MLVSRTKFEHKLLFITRQTIWEAFLKLLYKEFLTHTYILILAYCTFFLISIPENPRKVNLQCDLKNNRNYKVGHF